MFQQHTFTSKTEEIEFFKIGKPEIASKLIYHNEIYTLEIRKPSGTDKTIRKYYKKEQRKLNMFFEENREFYTYYRSANTCLDNKYFIRKNTTLS